MKKYLNILLLLLPLVTFSQAEEYIRKGNNLYNDGEYTSAETEYNKALELNSKSFEGAFNLGDSYFRQEKYEEAASQFETIADKAKDPSTKSWAYHNLGNALLQNKKIDESIEAYKNALRSNPNNEAARYNLAYAQKLKQQQDKNEENKNQNNKDKNEENKGNKENEEKDKKEGDNNSEDNNKKKDENENENENKDKKENEGDNKEQQPRPQQLSKEDAKRLLEAQKNQEQRTQDKLKELKAKKGKKVKIEKDW